MTYDQEYEILQAYGDGASFAEIARRAHVQDEAVHSILARYGISASKGEAASAGARARWARERKHPKASRGVGASIMRRARAEYEL